MNIPKIKKIIAGAARRHIPSALAFLTFFSVTGCYRASGFDRPELVAMEMPAVGGDRILGNKSMAGAGDYYIGNDFVALAVDGTPVSEASGIAGAPGAGSIVDVGFISLDTSFRRVAMPCDMLDRLTTVVNQDPEISLVFNNFKAVNEIGTSRLEMYGKIHDPKNKISGATWDPKGFVLDVGAVTSISLIQLDRCFTIQTTITNGRTSPIGIRNIGDLLYQRGGGFRVLAAVNKDKSGNTLSTWGVDMPGTDFGDNPDTDSYSDHYAPLKNSVHSGPVAFMGVEPGAPTLDCHVTLGLLPMNDNDSGQFLVASDPQDSLSESRPIFPQRFVAGSLDSGADLAASASLSHKRRLYVKGGASSEPEYSFVPITQTTPNQATGVLNEMFFYAAILKSETLGLLSIALEGTGTRTSPVASELRFERYIGPEDGDPSKDDDQQHWLLERLEWMEPVESSSSTSSSLYDTPMSSFGVYLPEGTYRIVSKSLQHRTVLDKYTNLANADRPSLALPTMEIEQGKIFILSENISPERSEVFSSFGSRISQAQVSYLVSARRHDSGMGAVQPIRFSIAGVDGTPDPQQRRNKAITSHFDPITRFPMYTTEFPGDYHFRGGNGAFGVQLFNYLSLWVEPGLYQAFASHGPLSALEQFRIDARPEGRGESYKELTIFNTSTPSGWYSFDVPGPSMVTSGGMLPCEQLASALAEGVSIVALSELDHQVDGNEFNVMFHTDLPYPSEWLEAIGGSREPPMIDPLVIDGRSSDLDGYGRATALFTRVEPGARSGGARPSAGWGLADFLAQAEGQYNIVNRPRGPQGLFTQKGFDPAKPLPAWWYEKCPLSQTKTNGQFDAIEIFNAGSIAEPVNKGGGIKAWWREYNALRLDWFSLLNQQAPDNFTKALGLSSGKYSQDTPVGLARTYLFTGDAEVSHTSHDPILKALKSGAAVASTGPMLEVSVGGKGPGELATIGASTSIELNVKLWAPHWIPIDEIRIVVNGELKSTVPNPRQVFAQSEEDMRCYEGNIQVPVPANKDAWLVVEAGAPLATEGPYMPGSPWTIHMKGIYPVAISNPIFLSRTGNYMPPGL